MIANGAGEAIHPPRYRCAAVTGHRPRDFTSTEQRWVRSALAGIVERLRRDHGTEAALTGLSRGVDTWWAQEALRAGLALWAYIPFEDQALKWPTGDRAEWARLRHAAMRQVTVGDGYSPSHFRARNDLLVRDCDLMVAVHQPSRTTGGTASTIRKARAAGRPMIRVDPSVRRVSFVAESGGAVGDER